MALRKSRLPSLRDKLDAQAEELRTRLELEDQEREKIIKKSSQKE